MTKIDSLTPEQVHIVGEQFCMHGVFCPFAVPRKRGLKKRHHGFS